MGVLELAREAFAKAKRERNDIPTERTAYEINERNEQSPPAEGERDAAGWTFIRGSWCKPGYEDFKTPFDARPPRPTAAESAPIPPPGARLLRKGWPCPHCGAYKTPPEGGP